MCRAASLAPPAVVDELGRDAAEVDQRAADRDQPDACVTHTHTCHAQPYGSMSHTRTRARTGVLGDGEPAPDVEVPATDTEGSHTAVQRPRAVYHGPWRCMGAPGAVEREGMRAVEPDEQHARDGDVLRAREQTETAALRIGPCRNSAP
eukprot:SAG11_NODE_6651_length_1273_cov_1.781090_1_plen_149_part_00